MTGDGPEPWRVVTTRTIVADRWITLRADDCEDARGRRIAPYYVLQPGDWISVLALDRSGDAIIVEEYRHGARIVAPGTIGGAVEPDESPLDAAHRELREETGFTASEVIDLGPTWANFGNHTNRVHHFLALDCVRAGEQRLDDTESIAVRVMPVSALGEHLTQSYHQLTWYKAMQYLTRQHHS
ncbi:NUDIX hydrolase [Microbacterium esteraromaticum]|uniref:NUDIX hydrolase n=1 Tax=Microbacterium esteraromaticum TaxID=57043 RepID=UPI001957D39E|nr:NUDIX hydrolase [Microbacterium esteraromaticum]MBM7464801.1 8-oxo-dGTP pyrophosphatase MutT (NUDIX family) [Microbacterium esteraromaticum]